MELFVAADFFQLLFLISQLLVFEIETNVGLKFGGDNCYLTGDKLDNTKILSNPKRSFLKTRYQHFNVTVLSMLAVAKSRGS